MTPPRAGPAGAGRGPGGGCGGSLLSATSTFSILSCLCNWGPGAGRLCPGDEDLRSVHTAAFLPASRSQKPRKMAPLTSRGGSVSRPGGGVASLTCTCRRDDKALGPGPSSWELTCDTLLHAGESRADTMLSNRPGGSERTFYLPAMHQGPAASPGARLCKSDQLPSAVWEPMSSAAPLTLLPYASPGTLLVLFWNLRWLPLASWLGPNSCSRPRTQLLSPACTSEQIPLARPGLAAPRPHANSPAGLTQGFSSKGHGSVCFLSP